MKRKNGLLVAVVVPLVCLLSVAVYYLPPVHDRLVWRVDELILRIKYTLNPPQEVVFTPQQSVTELTPTDLAMHEPLAPQPDKPTPLAMPTDIPPTVSPPTPMPTITPYLLPSSIVLSGVRYQDQHGRFNYCAPANLAMALSFWGWEGNQDVVGPFIKPNNKDKNVMPYEMVDYIETQTDLLAVERVGGDLDTLKRFLAAGYPVLIERGVYLNDLTGVLSWMGHYQVITGFDDDGEFIIAQDSFVKPDHHVPYDELLRALAGVQLHLSGNLPSRR